MYFFYYYLLIYLYIDVPCPSIITETSKYPETNAGEISEGNCIGDYTSKKKPTRLCNINGTWSDIEISDNCKIESFIKKWGGLIFGLIAGAIIILLLSCFIVYCFHKKHISHWKSEVEEMDKRWKEHNDGDIQKVEFNTTSAKKVQNNNFTQSKQQQQNLFIPDQNIDNNNNNNINPSTLFPKNTWLKQQVEVGYDDDEYYEEGEEEEGEEYEEGEEEYEEEIGGEELNNQIEKPTQKHRKNKQIVSTLEKIDEEEDEEDEEFNY